jgi:prepilin-type N-terminal cleavage/methylation domain-containing protein
MRTRWRRVRESRADAGVTLVELLVAAVVASIVLGALSTMFVGSLSASRRASESVNATAEGRQAIDTMGRRLRVALRPAAGQPVFSEATETSMTFTASLSQAGSTADPAPSTVRYVVDAVRRCVLETITPAAGPTRSACVGTGDMVLTFRYFQVPKRPTLERPTPAPVPTPALALAPTGLSTADALVVGAVEVSLAVRDLRAPSTTRPVTLRTRVLLDNDLNEVIL